MNRAEIEKLIELNQEAKKWVEGKDGILGFPGLQLLPKYLKKTNPASIERLCRQLLAQDDALRVAREALRNIGDNYDCDSDAHRYDTPCRACDAQKTLAELRRLMTRIK